MADLVPNGPMDRISYVIKTYRDTKNRRIIPETIEASLALVGQDAASTAFADHYNPLWHYLFSDGRDADNLRHQMLRDGRISPEQHVTHEELEAYVDETFNTMPHIIRDLAPDLPDRHPHDFLIPWMAKELGRLSKAIRRGNATGRDFEDASTKLVLGGPSIAMWAQQERVDLTKTSLADALDAIKDFEVEGPADMPQGAVVYDFGDGWTIQNLRNKAQLEAEGEVMQHCVGSYCAPVQSGETIIYSLRDPIGKPHATIEWSPDFRSDAFNEVYRAIERDRGVTGPRDVFEDPIAFLDSDFTRHGTFEQIRGKQNEMPAPKYRERIQEFIKKRFHSDPLGLLMVALPGQKISFKGLKLENVNFGDEFAFGDVPLGQADFSGATLTNCTFPQIEMVQANNAHLERCHFQEAVFDCSFAQSKLIDCQFFNDVVDCHFENANVAGEGIGGRRTFHREIFRTNMKGVEFYRVNFGEEGFRQCDLDMAQMMLCYLDRTEFRSCSMNGFEFVSDNLLREVALYDIDLTDVGDETAMMFRQNVIDALDVQWPDLADFGETGN